MKAWSSWFPDLLPHVPGCPVLVAEHELRRAAQAFFRGSRAWRVEVAPAPVAAGTDLVLVTPADVGQELVSVESARYDGRYLRPVTPDMLDADYPDGWSDITGHPTHYLQWTPGEIRLFPVPASNSVTGLALVLSVAPSEASTGLPDDLAIRFRDDIQVGAKARLMIYPGKPWSNMDLAGVYGAAFDTLLNRATAAAAKGHNRARILSRVDWF